ncbi:MAG: DUF2905 domain-containing protein [Chloroflexi bacterium]|jgi:hypothetical protein|nr:DUF2905 domain-containing protein [Chloroflexota bacterium]
MSGFEGFGKILIIAGSVLTGVGLFFAFGGHIPFLGKLPGDILIKKGGVSFYFPIITCVLLSVGLTLIVNFVVRFMNR